jgi:peptide/nickel transport system ATP-binding protein
MRLEVEDLRITFPAPGGEREVVRGVSFVMERERIGIVGESGSGKSLTVRALLGLLPRRARLAARRLALDGTDLLTAPEPALRRLRGRRIGFVMQDPKFSLNPVMRAGAQIAEVMRVHLGLSRRAAWSRTLDLLGGLGIADPERIARAYPHELSGGLGQRVMIAIALAADPELLIADEPTSALDATVQAEILRLLERLAAERGMGLILVSHDLPLVSRIAERILVMYAGRIVEELAAGDLAAARHPYTQGLIGCLPRLGEKRDRLVQLARDPAWAEAAGGMPAEAAPEWAGP